MIKKQYFISLLGLAAISIPLGTSLQSTSLNYNYETPSAAEASKTNWTIDQKNSGVVVFDTSEDDKVSSGDTLQAINVNASGSTKYSNNDFIYIYAGVGDQTSKTLINEIGISISALLSLEQTTSNPTGISFVATSDDEFANRPNLWNYELDQNSVSGFTIKVESTSIFSGTNDKIGSVLIKDVFQVKTDTTLSIGIPTKGITWTDAEVNYKVEPGQDVYGTTSTLTNITWWSYAYTYDEEKRIYVLDKDENEEPIKVIHDQNVSPTPNIDDTGKVTSYTGTLTWTNLVSDTEYKNTNDVDPDEIIKDDPYGPYGSQIITTMSDGSSQQEFVEFKSAPKSAPIQEASTINIDENNGLLQIEGTITSNGSFIEEVLILDETGNIIGTDPINHSNKSLNYSVYTKEYNKADLEGYRLQIIYTLDTLEEDETPKEVIYSSRELQVQAGSPQFVDLSELLALGAGAVIGIIIGALVLFGILLWLGWIWYKKAKAKKA